MILSHYPSAQGPHLPICVALGGKPHRTSTFPLFLPAQPRTHLEILNVKKPFYHSFYIIIIDIIIITITIIIQISVSHKSRGAEGLDTDPWSCPGSPALLLLPSWHRVMLTPWFSDCASAEHHMPKALRDLRVKDPCQGEGAGAAGRAGGSRAGAVQEQCRGCRRGRAL